MGYKRRNSECFKLVTIKQPESKEISKEEKDGFKKTIDVLVNMNRSFPNSGVKKGSFYFDKPHISYKLYKKDSKIHQYMNLPIEEKNTIEPLKPLMQSALKMDIGQYKLESEKLELTTDNLHAFAIKGLPQYAIQLDKEFYQGIRSLFRFVGPDQLLYSLTVKETEDHKIKRNELSQRLAGLDPDNKKAMMFHQVKKFTSSSAKALYHFWTEEEKKEKHREYKENFQARMNQLFPKRFEEKHMLSKRKLAETNKYMQVEVLFLLWTEEKEKAQHFKSELQQLMTTMQGENQLQVVEIQPSLKRVEKGQLHYDDVPQLLLYQKELSKFLILPTSHEISNDFYYEQPQKTEIPKEMYKEELGAISFARDLNSNAPIVQPKPRNTEDKDDYSTPVIVPGQMGAGKSVQLANQVVETFCVGAKDRKEWKKNARSAILFDVADGEMISSIMSVIPEGLHDRVKILNHFDTENPIPINSHDLLKLNRRFGNEGAEFDLAQMETELLLDSLDDKSSTISVERYYQNALQASYTLGKGTMLDAMRILMDEKYRGEMIQGLAGKDDILRYNLQKDDMALRKDEKGVTLGTIDNHLSQVQNNKPWLDMISQEDNSDIDFWKWMNGDRDGAYLVLIFIPEKVGKHVRRFLFAHYFLKIWKLMKLREAIPKAQRKECLVIVDEIHQIIEQRAVQRMFGDIFKEPRKYRVRYFFTFHGWSSLEKAGRNKKEIIRSMKDSGCNLIMLKGGKETFEDVASMLEPYNLDDFNSLMNRKFTAIFKIAHGKKSNVFMAQLIEPLEKRFPLQQKIELTKHKNKYGRSKLEVRQQITKELNVLLEVLRKREEALQEKRETKTAKSKQKQMKEDTINV